MNLLYMYVRLLHMHVMSKIYCNEDLDFMLDLTLVLSARFFFMDDNARPHRASITELYLAREWIDWHVLRT